MVDKVLLQILAIMNLIQHFQVLLLLIMDLLLLIKLDLRIMLSLLHVRWIIMQQVIIIQDLQIQ